MLAINDAVAFCVGVVHPLCSLLSVDGNQVDRNEVKTKGKRTGAMSRSASFQSRGRNLRPASVQHSGV